MGKLNKMLLKINISLPFLSDGFTGGIMPFMIALDGINDMEANRAYIAPFVAT